MINMLCDLALVYGFVEQKTQITTDIVNEVVKDKLQSGLSPLQPPANAVVENSHLKVNDGIFS